MAEKKTKTIGKEDRVAKKKEKKLSPEEVAAQEERARRQELLFEAKTLFKTASEARRRYDWEWLARDLYRRGYQFATWNASNNTLVMASSKTAKIPINLTWAQMRAIKNQVTNFRPKWEVLPAGAGEDKKLNAEYSEYALDYVFDDQNLRRKIKETVMQGLSYSVGGPWEITYDESANDGEGGVVVWLHDPYDFYIDPEATSLEEAEYVVKAVRRPLAEVMTNPNYNFADEPKGENRVAASIYKQFLLQTVKYQGQGQSEESDQVILFEMWRKERVTEENLEQVKEELKQGGYSDAVEPGNVRMRVITWVDTCLEPLRCELTDEDEYPFRLYQADINPLEIYGEGWIKHIIPVNRGLNALESGIFNYNYKYAVGRIVMDKNAGVRIVTNEHGSIIEKNRGAEVQFPTVSPLPASHENQVLRFRQHIEDLGGAHDVSLGRIPTGVKSGIGIAELKQADASNQSDLVDNLEDFLCSVGERVLKVIAKHYTVPKLMQAAGREEDEFFFVVGEEAGGKRKKRKLKIGDQEVNLAVIGARNKVRVTIGSWLAYTQSAQQEKIENYYQMGLIDQKTALQHLKFGDIDNIIERSRMEELLKRRREPVRGAQDGQGLSDEEIALAENDIMIEEGRVPEVLAEDDHEVHIAVHREVAQVDQSGVVEQHIQQHERMLGAAPPATLAGAGSNPDALAMLGAQGGREGGLGPQL